MTSNLSRFYLLLLWIKYFTSKGLKYETLAFLPFRISYRVFHIKNNCVEESSHILFEESHVDKSHDRDSDEEFAKTKVDEENQEKEQNLQRSIAEAS